MPFRQGDQFLFIAGAGGHHAFGGMWGAPRSAVPEAGIYGDRFTEKRVFSACSASAAARAAAGDFLLKKGKTIF